MFYYLDGKVALIEKNLAVIDVGGAGYAVNTSMYTLSSLRQGENTRLYTYLYVKEEIFELFGFLTLQELNCFRLLIGVSGVGPKAALSLLSSVPPDRLALAIVTMDDKTLTLAQGIGKKIAQRIALELKDKIAKEQAGLRDISPPRGSIISGGKVQEALEALAMLGYSQSEAALALDGMDVERLGLEEIIRGALKKMAPKK